MKWVLLRLTLVRMVFGIRQEYVPKRTRFGQKRECFSYQVWFRAIIAPQALRDEKILHLRPEAKAEIGESH